MLQLIVSKRTFRLAVDRNRARRRVRAVLNKLKPAWRRQLSGTIVLDKRAVTLPFPELERYVLFLLEKARIL